MLRYIAILICFTGLFAAKIIYGYSHEESVREGNASGEVAKTHAEHHGVKRDLGFSNFLEGWLGPACDTAARAAGGASRRPAVPKARVRG